MQDDAHSDSDREPMVKLEQKIISLIKDLLFASSNPGQLVLDHFAATMSTANGCLLTEVHRRFIGCAKDV